MDIKVILDDLKKGRLVVLTDDPDRENEGDLIAAAQCVTPSMINFMARYGRGLICVPLLRSRAESLALSLLPKRNVARLQHCNFTVSVDAVKGISTGISAHDRANTIRLLADENAGPQNFSTPGHVFPLIADENGVFGRRGHTEGTLDLLKMAGMKEAGVICEIMGDEGVMLSGRSLRMFAKKHELSMYSIAELIAYKKTRPIELIVQTKLPMTYGNPKIFGYKNGSDDKEHLALVFGDIRKNTKKGVLVRIHSECLTGDVFESTRCDCNMQLNGALNLIKQEGAGILIYLRTEGRGIGLLNKLKSYVLQDKGLDTVEANEALGFSADLREYGIAAQILNNLGVKSIRLITNNPQKISDLKKAGIKIVQRVVLAIKPQNVSQRNYLDTKRKKMGHY